MSEKSWVSLEQHQCPVCGKIFDTGNIILDNRLRETFDKYTVAGNSLCPEHQKQFDEGYRFLVEIEGTPDNPKYTGKYAAVRKEALNHILTGTQDIQVMAYIDTEAMAKIEEMFIQSKMQEELHD